MKIDFSDKIRILREEKGMTQGELAKKLRVSKSILSSYERGVYQPRHETVVLLAQVFGVSVDFLYGLRDAANPLAVRHIDLSDLTENDVDELSRIAWTFREKNRALAAKEVQIAALMDDSGKA